MNLAEHINKNADFLLGCFSRNCWNLFLSYSTDCCIRWGLMLIRAKLAMSTFIRSSTEKMALGGEIRHGALRLFFNHYDVTLWRTDFCAIMQENEIIPSKNNLSTGACSADYWLFSYFSRGTISVISFSFLMSSSLQGAQKEPIIPTMNCDRWPMSRAPFSACCWIRGRSRTSSIRACRRPWPGRRKDSSVCSTEEEMGKKRLSKTQKRHLQNIKNGIMEEFS